MQKLGRAFFGGLAAPIVTGGGLDLSVAVRLLIGVGSSVAQAMILAWLVGGAGRVARGRVMARSEAFFSIIGLVSPALSGLLAGPLGWRVAFLLGAIAAAIGFLAVLSLTRPASAARAVGFGPPSAASAPRSLASFDQASSAADASAAPAVGFGPPSAAAGASAAPGAGLGPPSAASEASAAPGAGVGSSSATAYSRGRREADAARRASPLTGSLLGGWRELRLGGHVLLSAYIATFVVFFCRNGLLNAVLPVLGADRFGIQPSEIGLVFSSMSALSIVVVLLGGRAGDRFGRYRLLAPGLALLLACELLLFVVQDARSYVVVGLLQSLSFFVNPLPPVLLGDTLPPRARPRAIGVYRATSDLALLSAPAVMGGALQLGGFAAAELASVMVVAAALALLMVVALPRRAL